MNWSVEVKILPGSRLPNTHGYDSFFIRFNSVPKIFDSTQLMTHNDLTGIHSNQLKAQNEFSKFDSNRLMTQKAPRIF